jgi:hypothetical protein
MSYSETVFRVAYQPTPPTTRYSTRIMPIEVKKIGAKAKLVASENSGTHCEDLKNHRYRVNCIGLLISLAKTTP